MRRLLLSILFSLFICSLVSCHRKVCPAYQSAFLIGEGDAEEYFSYFSSFDSLPKDSGIFQGRSKTKNGLVRRKTGPALWTLFSRSEFENRYNFPKAISTKNYCPDTTGMASEEDIEELIAMEEGGKRKRKRKKDRKEETTSVTETGIMGEGSVEDDLADDTNMVTPTVDESTGEALPDSLAQDSTEVILKFSDQLIYESLFGDPNEKAAADSTATEEDAEEEKPKKGLFGGLFGGKKKKDRKKNSIVAPAEEKKTNDNANKDEDDS